ncbi:hypothetical protein C7S16_3592 [Burkholderia thailandensis]|uniref:Uncharacterized protein n=1 Tax=Burkholderia thailandensis TaxID=57975 RepID=A0AAW9CV42_BURTH|nr:hypothetical protein [Burkholderia thailandensis]
MTTRWRDAFAASDAARPCAACAAWCRIAACGRKPRMPR